jgi:hypothetical protein
VKKNKAKNIILPFLAVVILSLNSCIGLSMDIQMNRDGSGRLTLEYRLSNALDSLGRLEGNEFMPTIPVSRQDWERTAERIPGITLISHSRRETSQDTVISTVLNFSNPDGLISLLTSTGVEPSINLNSQGGNFDLIIFNEPDVNLNENLIQLTRPIFNDYNFSISFSAPGNSAMTITDGKGNTISAPASAATTMSGRRVSLSMGIFDILDLQQGLGVKFNW